MLLNRKGCYVVFTERKPTQSSDAAAVPERPRAPNLNPHSNAPVVEGDRRKMMKFQIETLKFFENEHNTAPPLCMNNIHSFMGNEK